MTIQTFRYAKNERGSIFQEVVTWEEHEENDKTLDGSLLGFPGKHYLWRSIANCLGVVPQIKADQSVSFEFDPSIYPTQVREGLTLITEEEALLVMNREK